jgi:hypothetical protein
MLLNEHFYYKGQIAIVGVENWGIILRKREILKLLRVYKRKFKILMSHDPSHWEYEIKTMKKLSPNTVRSYTWNAIWN